jgi:hypothetical protein
MAEDTEKQIAKEDKAEEKVQADAAKKKKVAGVLSVIPQTAIAGAAMSKAVQREESSKMDNLEEKKADIITKGHKEDAEKRKKDAEEAAGSAGAEGGAGAPVQGGSASAGGGSQGKGVWGTLKSAGGTVGKGTAFVGGAAIGAMAAGGSVGSAVSAHVKQKENMFFLAILFISLLDALNNMSRSTTTVQINIFLLVCIGVLLLASLLFPTKMLFAVIGLGVVGFIFYQTGYMSYNLPTFSASILFFFVFLIIFFWAWLGVFSVEGQGLFSRESLKIFALCLGLSALAYFMPLIRSAYLPSNAIIDGIIVVAPVWLVYMLFFKADTQMIKMLGGLYIIFWLLLILFKSGAAQAVVYGTAKTAQDVENLKGQATKTQKELTGESIHGEVKEGSKKIFIGVELLDPLIGYGSKFDPDTDMTIKVGAQVHTYGGFMPDETSTLSTSLTCYGGSSDVVKSTSEFIDISKFSLATMNRKTFSGDTIIPEDVTCTYEAKSRKNQVIVMQAVSRGFVTGAYIENFYIDKTSLTNRLKRYALDNKKTLSSVADVRSAIGSIDEYSDLPSRVYSYSDNSPALLVMTTSDFPLVGIDNTEGGMVNLKVAIENKVPTSGKVGTFNGRVEKLSKVELTIPSGLSPASSGCSAWTKSGNTITLSSGSLTTMNTKLKKLKKGEQARLPDCALTLSDATAILLKTDRPNPATVYGQIYYDYSVQRSYSITSQNTKPAKNTTTSTPVVATKNTTGANGTATA